MFDDVCVTAYWDGSNRRMSVSVSEDAGVCVCVCFVFTVYGQRQQNRTKHNTNLQKGAMSLLLVNSLMSPFQSLINTLTQLV